MPRYFFHLHNEIHVSDDEGVELPDLAAAHAYAVANIRDLLKEEVGKGRIKLSHRIVVEEETGGRTMVVAFSEAVTIER